MTDEQVRIANDTLLTGIALGIIYTDPSRFHEVLRKQFDASETGEAGYRRECARLAEVFEGDKADIVRIP